MRKTLKETIGDKAFTELLAKTKGNKFFEAVERSLRKTKGEAIFDNGDITAVGEVYAAVIEGLLPYLSREIAQTYFTEKTSLTFHYNKAYVTGDLSGNSETQPTEDKEPITVTPSRERGLSPAWNRSYLEDASWDVMAEEVKMAGEAIEEDVMAFIISEYLAGAAAVGATAIYDFAGSVTWAKVCAAIGEAESNNAHPDVAIVSPVTYADLLALDQFVSSLYAGSDEVMRTGIAKTTFGITFVRSSKMAAGNSLASGSGHQLGLLVEKAKAGALVIRADTSIEPYELPKTNEYGFTARIRYGFDTIVPKATHLLSNC